MRKHRSSWSRAVVVLSVGVMCCSALLSPHAQGAPKRLSEYNISGLDAKVNLTSIDPMDIVQLIEFLAHRGGLNNIVVGQGVSGTTAKLKFDDVTVADALETVLSVNRLAYEIRGGILTIMTDAEYQGMHGQSFFDQTVTRIVTLKYADPTRVSKMLSAVKSSIGTVISDPVTGALILKDTPDRIDAMQQVIDAADIATVNRILPTESRSFRLQYAEVATVRQEVETLITRDVGQVQADERTKTLIVDDLPHAMERIAKLIEVFDRCPKQVFIEAKIAQVNLSDTFSMGVNWEHLFEGLDPRFSLQTVSSPSTLTDPTFSLSYNTIAAGGDLSIVVDALKTVGETKILSNPQIAVIDGQEARIEVVEDQPYKETQLEAGTTNITGVTYLFKKVGVQLAVTPRINDEDVISVNVRPEISEIVEWYDGDDQEGTPVVNQSITETTVIVRDSTTIIIGGMIRDRKDDTTKSVPLLGQIPILGRLFRQDTVTKSSSEIIVFLTPRIITAADPDGGSQDQKKAPKLLTTGG